MFQKLKIYIILYGKWKFWWWCFCSADQKINFKWCFCFWQQGICHYLLEHFWKWSCFFQKLVDPFKWIITLKNHIVNLFFLSFRLCTSILAILPLNASPAPPLNNKKNCTCPSVSLSAMQYFTQIHKWAQACHLSPVTWHLSLVTKPTATATDPPPANSPNMYSRLEWKTKLGEQVI